MWLQCHLKKSGRGYTLALPGTKDSNKSSTNSLNADLPEATLVLKASTNLDDTDDKSLSKKRGRRRKNGIPIVNKFVPASDVEVELGVDVSAVPSQEKQLGVTVEPNYENHNLDRMILCDEVMPSRVANTNTTRLIVPPSIALPRVVLCLAHNGKVAWDAKWRPNTSESQEHMGYLAVLFGNGSLEVWDVPLPNTVKGCFVEVLCTLSFSSDPFGPLWEFNSVQRAILSLDWLKDPSLLKVVSDVPVTGKKFHGNEATSSACSSVFIFHNLECPNVTGNRTCCLLQCRWYYSLLSERDGRRTRTAFGET